MDDDELQIYVPINNDLDRRIADNFDIFDHAGTKTIDVREVGTVIRAIGCCPSEAEIQELVLRMEEPTNPGNVHLVKFLPLVTTYINEHRNGYQTFFQNSRGRASSCEPPNKKPNNSPDDNQLPGTSKAPEPAYFDNDLGLFINKSIIPDIQRFMPSTPEQLLLAFQALDTLGKGFLTKEYLSTIITQDGEPFTQDELDEMLEIAVDPHEQTIPYEYYINQLMYEAKGDSDDVYKMADEIEASRPQRTRSRRFSSMFNIISNARPSETFLRKSNTRY